MKLIYYAAWHDTSGPELALLILGLWLKTIKIVLVTEERTNLKNVAPDLSGFTKVS